MARMLHRAGTCAEGEGWGESDVVVSAAGDAGIMGTGEVASTGTVEAIGVVLAERDGRGLGRTPDSRRARTAARAAAVFANFLFAKAAVGS